jgi:two-component system, OmpR family, response regulator
MNPLAGVSILVVDDNDDSLELMEICLSLAGASVRTADSASAAHRVVAEFKPDVLISDISLPDEDGCHMLKSLLATFDLRQRKAIAVTGYSEADVRGSAERAGFHAYVVKPVTVPVLTDSILRLLAEPNSSSPV